MALITDDERAQLLENGRRIEQEPAYEPEPVARLYFNNDLGTDYWLLCAADPKDPDKVRTLHSTDMPEFGENRTEESLSELATRTAQRPENPERTFRVERDHDFRPAREKGRSVFERYANEQPTPDTHDKQRDDLAR